MRESAFRAGLLLLAILMIMVIVAIAGCTTAKNATKQLEGYTLGFEKADTVCTVFLASETGAVVLQRLPDDWCALIPIEGRFTFKLNSNQSDSGGAALPVPIPATSPGPGP